MARKPVGAGAVSNIVLPSISPLKTANMRIEPMKVKTPKPATTGGSGSKVAPKRTIR